MPPSPALRFSPSRELRGENHKRGHSLGGGVHLKEKVDDLALFSEMESRERENFLLQSLDDFEDTFSSKLKHLSDVKLEVLVPAQGESSELLNIDGEKNDYDWLLTPPDTPLFPSLDDEAPEVTAASRGRPKSQPISISRSSTMEKSNRSSRGSASPNRLSPSPRSGNGTIQSRARPSSAPRSSPTRSVRSATPTRGPSSPAHKPSTSAPRSSTPTSRRISTGSGALGSSAVRGTSPIKTSRGNSASPKVRAWQSNIPGFVIDTPPNLRTSLADRPASYVRGSSPASRSSRDSSARYPRQSASPTPSRSVSSSHSHDRDRFSSHSKGSAVSSMDDDSDSLQSGTLGGSEYSFSKTVGSCPSNRGLSFSKKPSRIISPSSAPKRSFDSAIRQMDHRKNPQNMFRPLLSSAPSTTFYVGKGSSSHVPLFSRNSSMTTSSNASLDQSTSFVPDSGGVAHQDDLAEYEKVPHPAVQEEVFAYDKLDILHEETRVRSHNSSLDIQHGDFDSVKDSAPCFSQDSSYPVMDIELISDTDALRARGDLSELGNLKKFDICSKCRQQYITVEPVEEDISLCPSCREQHDLLRVTVPDTPYAIVDNPLKLAGEISEEYKSLDEMVLPVPVSELLPEDSNELESVATQPEKSFNQGQDLHDRESQSCLQENSTATSLVDGSEERLNFQQELDQPTISQRQPDMDCRDQQLQLSSEHSDLHVESSEGAGISVLLKRSGSSKGPVVQGRTFIATPNPYEDLPYTRDSANSFRSSTGYASASASSSVDYTPARKAETRVQQQLSGKESDMENSRSDFTLKSPSSISSLSGVSNHEHQASGLATVASEELSQVPVAETILHGTEERDSPISQVKVPDLEDRDANITDGSFTGVAAIERKNSSMDSLTSELSSSTISIRLEDSSVPSYPVSANTVSGEDVQRTICDTETAHLDPESPLEEHNVLANNLDEAEVTEVPGHGSLTKISEIEIEDDCHETSDSQTHGESPKSENNNDGFQELPLPDSSYKDVDSSVPDPNTSDHPHSTSDESTVLMESRGGSKARSLTLEEATDTILFCSSIVHDLAYQAANIAIEREIKEPLEDPPRPTVMVLGKSNTDRKDRTVRKRTSKLAKARQRQVETDLKSPCKTENDENAGEPMMRNVGIPNKPDDMKPPKLESKCNCTIM